MPAIITHDFFGRDMLGGGKVEIGNTQDERDAFLLGNQGPDPLFYTMISPTLRKQGKLGNVMHDEKPTQLLQAFAGAVDLFENDERDVARAYALGFLCHYTLDSTMHPLVYAQQYAICEAGVDGVTSEDGGEIHGIIEAEFDEMVLYTKSGKTIANFNTATEILQASKAVLQIVSKMYEYVAKEVYGEAVSSKLFGTAVKDSRTVQHVFYSRTGAKRALIGQIEQTFRRYSFYLSMSHRVIEATTCDFDNHENAEWKNPFTGEVTTDSFWNRYDSALKKASKNIKRFEKQNFAKITKGLNFSGNPVE